MKNYAVIALLACVAFVTLAATPSHAQILMKADVPFSFSAGYGMLPAGEYSISTNGSEFVLALACGQRTVEFMLPKTIDWGENVKSPKLIFHRYGEEYFLAEIWTSADGAVRTLPVNRREQQLAKNGVSPEMAVVYAESSSRPGR